MNLDQLALEGVQVRPNAFLRDHTTFRLGGPCPALLTCDTPARLIVAVRTLAAFRVPFVLIGGGSNLLVADEGLPEFVVCYRAEQPAIHIEGRVLYVLGCTLLDDLARCAAEQGLGGLSFASGIPGTVGGALAGNAGAFGRQIGDCTVAVHLMDRIGSTRWEDAARLDFAYRSSRIQHSGEIVVAARLRLAPGNRESLLKEREEILRLRREKHPDWRTTPTAGSFFKNLEPTSAAERRQAAGWFLEQAGAKAMRVGGARVFEKHANIIVAGPGCTAADARALSQKMADAVRERFGLTLTPEVRMLGCV